MKHINDPANPSYDFGLEFNYALWVPGTRVTLCNVPWNNDYRDIVQFPTTEGVTLDQYIDSKEASNLEIDDLSYLKPNQPIRIKTPFNTAYRYNYLRASNPIQPIPNDIVKEYYYFILDVIYVAPNTTELVIQLDVWQTFGPEATFGNSYIERGHIGIANENSFDNYGRDYLTVPEGIDYGGEYRIIDRKADQVIENEGFYRSGDNRYTYQTQGTVLVVSTVDFDADPGTVTAPTLITAHGGTFETLASGASIYYFASITDFLIFMANHSDTPWVTQGIISITIVPNLTRYDSDAFNRKDISESGTPIEGSFFDPGAKITPMYNGWRDDIVSQIPERYRSLKKFLTYPYMVIEMTTWTGMPIILKPESWTDPDATIVESFTLTPPNQRVVFRPKRYNANPDSVIDNPGHLDDVSTRPSMRDSGDDGGEYLDLTTMIANFPTMAIVNNGALGYLASNFAGIPYQRESAAWSQQRALRGNQVSYDQATKGINTTSDTAKFQNSIKGIGVGYQNEAANNAALINGFGGLGKALINPTNIKGAVNAGANSVLGALNTNNEVNLRNNQLGNSQMGTSGQASINNRQASFVRDTNKSLADWSANGDYENTIAGINAMVQDASMTQPSTSGQAGGETFNMANGNVEVSLRWKLIDNAAIRNVGDYWFRYGYSVRKFANITTLKVMSKFTYWKLQETYIIAANMPEGFKQIIRGIFEKGVTVWADPSFIGTTDIADNVPLEGITI